MASDIVLHRSQRATLLRDSGGDLMVISPMGRRYPISRERPCVLSIAAAWLGMTEGQILEFVPPEVVRP